jgi:uncharacterized protein YndB with AHSA1/START domain
MTKLLHDIHINASIDEVWAVLADLEAVQHYNPMVAGARCVSNSKQGVGATRICDFRPGGSATERITEWQPPQAMSMEAIEHPWPMESVRWRNQLTPTGEGTRLSQVLEYELTGDRAMAAEMEAQWSQGLNAVFAGLKAYVEANTQRKR